MRYGTGKKFIMIVSIIFIVSFIIFSTLVINNIRKKLDYDTQSNLIEISTQGSEVIKNKIGIYENNVELLSNMSLIKDKNIDKKDKISLLNEVAKSNGFMKVGVVDSTGIGYTSLEETIEISQDEYFKKIIKNKKNATERITNKENNTDYIIHTSPIIVDGKIEGIVFANTLMSDFNENIFPYLFKGSSNLLILDKNLDILLDTIEVKHKDDFNITSKDSTNKIEDEIKNRKVGAQKIKVNDFNGYIGYAPINIASDWTLVSVVEQSVASSSMIDIGYYTIKVAIVLFIILILIVALIIRTKNKVDEEIDYLAFVDDITGIGNYNKFLIDAKEILDSNKNKNYAIVYFDIDYFQVVNETFGYSFGDIVLWEIAQILKEILPNDSIYTRYYKDNFIYLASYEHSKSEIIEIVEKVSDRISRIKIGNKDKVHISAVSGIYYNNDEDISISAKVNKANIARVEIKGNSLQKYNVFCEDIRNRQLEEINLIEKIKLAIKNNEFEVYYQPKVNVNTEKIVGCEALIRWTDKEGKFISPSDFIPVAEKNGLIEDIDRWVFRRVCIDIKQWKEKNVKVYPVSINLSRSNLYCVDLIESIQNCLKEYDIETELVEIEITETATTNDTEYIISKVQEIRNLGIKISMDDFGVGNSSLTSLSTLPLDTLKLDRSFIVDANDDPKRKYIINSIVSLAKSLELNIVAEGVETKSQCEYLKSLGCDIIQGYYYAKPMDKESLYKNFLT